MKFLESFHNFFYQEIQHEEYAKLMGSTGVRMGTNRVPFTLEEREILKDYLKENPNLVTFEFDIKIMSGSRHLEIKFKHGNIILTYGIDKVKDEWFAVFRHRSDIIQSKNWKCDQFDGLLRLLKDQGIIDF